MRYRWVIAATCAMIVLCGSAHAFNETSGGMLKGLLWGAILLVAVAGALVVLLIWAACSAVSHTRRSRAAAETGVGAPPFTRQDSIIQGAIVLACVVPSAAVGLIMSGPVGVGIGALIGLVTSLVVSGAVVMVRSWRRGAGRQADPPRAGDGDE